MVSSQSRVPCAFWWHVGPGQPLGDLLLSDALGRAGRNIYPSFQPHDWGPCEVCEAGVWRAVHQAAAWPER